MRRVYHVLFFLLLTANLSAQSRLGIPTYQSTKVTIDSLKSDALRMYHVGTFDAETGSFSHIVASDAVLLLDYLNVSYTLRLGDHFSSRLRGLVNYHDWGGGLSAELDYRFWNHGLDGYYVGPSVTYLYNRSGSDFLLDHSRNDQQVLGFGLWFGRQFIWGSGLALDVASSFGPTIYRSFQEAEPVANRFSYAARLGLGYSW